MAYSVSACKTPVRIAFDALLATVVAINLASRTMWWFRRCFSLGRFLRVPGWVDRKEDHGSLGRCGPAQAGLRRAEKARRVNRIVSALRCDV
jgi:hypothetical protein